MPARINYEQGDIVHGYTYLAEADKRGKQRHAFFMCKCGKTLVDSFGHIKDDERGVCKHIKQTGHTYDPIYKRWLAMKSRCYDTNKYGFHRYGGRGIKVCDEWKDDPKAFIKWAEANGYRKGLQLDRIDNDGDYTPDNCRFVTSAVNGRNSTNTKLDWDTVNEIRNAKLLLPSLTLRELGEAYSVDHKTIHALLTNKTWVEY